MTLVFETRTRQDLKYTQVRYTSNKKIQEDLRYHSTAMDIHNGKGAGAFHSAGQSKEG